MTKILNFCSPDFAWAQALTAEDARQVSGYAGIDYSIPEDATVLDAVQKFAAYNIGCLVTTDESGTYRVAL